MSFGFVQISFGLAAVMWAAPSPSCALLGGGMGTTPLGLPLPATLGAVTQPSGLLGLRPPLASLSAAPKRRRRRGWEEIERERLKPMTAAELIEDKIAHMKDQLKLKRQKSDTEGKTAAALLARCDENSSPLIRGEPAEASAEEKAHYWRMRKLGIAFFQLRKDLGLSGKDGTNEGCHWLHVAKDLTDLVRFLAGGIIAEKIELEGIRRVRTEPKDILRAQVLNPCAFSDTGLDVIGRCVKMPRYRGSEQGIIPSSTTVSDARCALTTFLRPKFEVEIDRMGWWYKHAHTLIVKLFLHFKVHEWWRMGMEPIDLKSWIDGAPTQKLINRTALLLHFLDGRLSWDIHSNPQDRANHHMLAEYFGDETTASLAQNFESLLNDLRTLTAVTYDVDGSTVQIAINHFGVPDMKARWSLVKGIEADPEDSEPAVEEDEEEEDALGSLPQAQKVGGGISNCTWSCDLGPCHLINRHRGPGGGCVACRSRRASLGQPCLPGRLVADEKDLFFWVAVPAEDGFREMRCKHSDLFADAGVRQTFVAERDAQLTRMRSESADQSIGPLRRAKPLLATKAARVREIHARIPRLTVAALEKNNVKDLDALLTAHCAGVVLADDERLPHVVVQGLNDSAVLKQLDLHNMTHDSADMSRCRTQLEQRLIDLIVLRQVLFALEWPGIPSSCLMRDMMMIGDVLHLEMRMGERILTLLFNYPLQRGYADSQSRLASAATALRKSTKWESFKYKFVPKSGNSKVAKFGLSRKRAKHIMKFLKDDVMPHIVKANDAHRKNWEQLLLSYVAAVEMMRTVPELRKGDPGYSEELAQFADDLQELLGTFCGAALRIDGDRVVSNYFYWLQSGYYRYWILKTQLYPYCWSNDGAERTNEDQEVWFHKHTARGGGGSDDASFASGLCDYALMKLAFMTGDAQAFFSEQGSDEASSGSRRGAHLADPSWRSLHCAGGRRRDHAAGAQARAAKRAARWERVAAAQGRVVFVGPSTPMET